MIDISPKEVDMFAKAIEIQNLWKPKVGDTMIALLQHRVKIIAINSNDTANVLLLPETSLPEGAVLVVNNVPFRYLLDDVPTAHP